MNAIGWYSAWVPAGWISYPEGAPPWRICASCETLAAAATRGTQLRPRMLG